MQFGADLNIPSFKGNYPIHKALYRANLQCFEELLKYSKTRSFTILPEPDLSVKNIHGFTPLEMVFNNDRERSLLYLIEKQSDMPEELKLEA